MLVVREDVDRENFGLSKKETEVSQKADGNASTLGKDEEEGWITLSSALKKYSPQRGVGDSIVCWTRYELA